MPFPLQILPTRTAGAAENMALDFLLLQRHPHPEAARFRHYGWRAPAFTFGFGQKIEFVRAQLPAGEAVDLCRRPTGGGVVDHRDDWTYALVVPRGHAWYDERAAHSYRAVHECLARALVALGRPAVLKAECDPCDTGPGVCFQRAELHDVIDPRTGAKLAGAAQKRNKHGLLLQGSIARTAAGPLDWEAFASRFTAELARALGADPVECPWPDLDEDEVSGLVDQYSAPEWTNYR